MLMADETEPRIALVIAAHPDDPDFGAGGTAAMYTKQGWEFHYLVCTNGAKGTGDREMTRDRLVPMREQEQRNAAEALGVKSCTFLGGEDGELDYDRMVLGKIVREIRRLQPHAVFTHTPEMIHHTPFRRIEGEEAEYSGAVNHRDHRNTGEMSTDAVYPTARDHLNFPEHLAEGLETHKVREIYFWGTNEPNYSIDITDVIDQKIEALVRHESQFGDRGAEFGEMVRERWKDEENRFHERFRRVVLPF
jgi:LmbE family N-acetylglucosaminyl deacetylase